MTPSRALAAAGLELSGTAGATGTGLRTDQWACRTAPGTSRGRRRSGGHGSCCEPRAVGCRACDALAGGDRRGWHRGSGDVGSTAGEACSTARQRPLGSMARDSRSAVYERTSMGMTLALVRTQMVLLAIGVLAACSAGVSTPLDQAPDSGTISAQVEMPMVVDRQVDSLTVFWLEPASEEPLTGYELRWREVSAPGWNDVPDIPSAKTNLVLSSLQEATEYEVQVRALSSVGEGAWSESLNAFTASSQVRPPVAPQSLGAEQPTANSVVVGWLPPVTDLTITKYLVQWIVSSAQQAVDWTNAQLGETPDNTPRFTVTDLEPSTIYLIRVSAVTDEAMGEWSEPISVQTDTAPGIVTPPSDPQDPPDPPDPPPPLSLMPAPANVSATASISRMDIDWDPVTPPAELTFVGYKIEWRKMGDLKWKSVTNTNELTDFAVVDLEAGTTYNVRVSAVGRKSDETLVFSNPTPPTDVTTEIERLQMPGPSGLVAEALGSRKFKVSWDAVTPPQGITLSGYKVQWWRNTSGTSWSESGGIGAARTSYTTDGVASSLANMMIKIAVRAEGHYADLSSVVSYWAPIDLQLKPVIPSPTNFGASLSSEDPEKVVLAWNMVTSLPSGITHTGYTLQHRRDGATLWSEQTPADISLRMFTIDTTEEDAPYQFRMRADGMEDGASVGSEWTDIKNVTTGALKLPEPTLVNAVSFGAGTILLTWSNVIVPAGVTLDGYRVQWKKSTVINWSDAESSVYKGIAATVVIGSSTDPLEEGATYNIRLRAEGKHPFFKPDGITEVPSHSAYVEAPDVTIPSTVVMPSTDAVAGTALTTSSIKVIWSAVTPPSGWAVTGYKLEWKNAADSSWTMVTPNVTGIEYTVVGLEDYTEYEFRVTTIGTNASSDDVESSATPPVSQFTKAVSTIPTVSDLTSCSSDTSSTELTWTGITLPRGYTDLKYEVRSKRSTDNVLDTVTTSAGTNTSFTLSGMETSVQYNIELRISAVNPDTMARVNVTSNRITASTQSDDLSTKPTLRVVGLYENDTYWTDTVDLNVPFTDGIARFKIFSIISGCNNDQGVQSVGQDVSITFSLRPKFQSGNLVKSLFG